MNDDLIEVKWTKQNRLRNLISSLSRLDKQDVRYGFFQESGNHPESPHLNYPTLAAIHELREDPQQRPILGISSSRNKNEMQKYTSNEIGNFVERAALLKRDSPGTLLRSIGEMGVKLTKPIFGDSSLLKPNTEATAKSKGFNRPMIDYGALKEALSSKISTNGKVS